jgi:hypothetical protein
MASRSLTILDRPLPEVLAGEHDEDLAVAVHRGAEFYPQCFGLIPYGAAGRCCEGHVKLGVAILAAALAARRGAGPR